MKRFVLQFNLYFQALLLLLLSDSTNEGCSLEDDNQI